MLGVFSIASSPWLPHPHSHCPPPPLLETGSLIEPESHRFGLVSWSLS